MRGRAVPPLVSVNGWPLPVSTTYKSPAGENAKQSDPNKLPKPVANTVTLPVDEMRTMRSSAVGWNGREYGLIPVGPNDELVMPESSAAFPEFIERQGSGTVVTFLGNADDDNTFVPPGRPKGWLLKYLNRRFFRLSDNRIEVLVRVPSGDVEDWPHSTQEASERMAGRGKSFNLTLVDGTGQIWDDATDRQGAGWRGTVDMNPVSWT